MKKVININFHGRVIPIEETAYDLLKAYIDSLRRYFANEEGRDEIVNDIESRMGELFSERLKSGITCITDNDVNNVIASMGRPEDFEAQGADAPPPTPGDQPKSTNWQQWQGGRGKLFRNADDKIIGGVCSGLANYLNIDPIITRIAFVLLSGALFWVYVLLWMVIPSKSMDSDITKRLYRNPDDKVVAGVASGIAAYFNIAVWIPRTVFVLPLIAAIFSNTLNSMWWDFDFAMVPGIISGSLSTTMVFSYLVLWIAVPLANSAAEKLEMRGEKVNLNSIANTVKGDLEQFKVRAEKWGSEVRSASRKTSSGLGNAIGVLFKAFFFFIFAIIALSLLGVLIGLLFGGIAFAPLQEYFFEGRFQHVLVWVCLVLLLVTPFVALVTWAIRRLMGVRSRNHSLGISFVGLWIAGLVTAFMLFYMLVRNYKSDVILEEEPLVTLPAPQTLFVQSQAFDWKNYNDNQLFGIKVDHDFPFYTKGDDSLLINTVRVNVTRSNDSAFHVYRVRASRGKTVTIARDIAEKIDFTPTFADSTVTLPNGFFISKKDKFRNQRVRIVVEVPVGKKVKFDESIEHYDWMEFGDNDNDYDSDEWDSRNNLHKARGGRVYEMNANGKLIDVTFAAH